MDEIEIVVRTGEHDAFVHDVLTGWAGTRVVSRGVLHDATVLPGFVALLDGEPAGLATYRIDGGACELVTLNSLARRRGIGSRLVDAVCAVARPAGCKRLWLITTNDNLNAQRFYEGRHFTVAAVHKGAIAESRRLKPEIPLYSEDGVPIEDEIEFELRL